MVKFMEVKAKTVLNKYRDNWFWGRYNLNPYLGCQFACNYCDTITEKHMIHENVEDFSRTIYARINAPGLIEKRLKESIRDLHSKNELDEISGVGENLARTIREFLNTGKCEKLERLKTE